MFTEKDKALHKGLMKLLEEGSFTLKAKEIAAFAEIYGWAKRLMDKPSGATLKPKKTKGNSV